MHLQFDADLFSRVYPVEYLTSVLENTITPNLQTLIDRFDQGLYASKEGQWSRNMLSLTH